MKKLILAIIIIGLTSCGRTLQTESVNGVNGSNGNNGVQGPQGPAGSTGQTGSNGSQGSTGTVGPQGPKGDTGTTGPKGASGSNGTNGSNGNGFNSGLECYVYSVLMSDENGTVNWNTMFSDSTFKFSTVLANFNVSDQSSNNIFSSFTSTQQALIGNTNYGLDCNGWIDIPETGSYTFVLSSDDGSELAIDNQIAINMPVLQSYTNKSIVLTLFSGLHRINVLYFQGPATNIGLTLGWKGPSNVGLGTLQTIPSTVFTH